MARSSRVTIAKRVTTDLRIEPGTGDRPARLIATSVGQDKEGNTVDSDTLNVEATDGSVPPAVRQAIDTIVTYVDAWGKDGA